MTLEELEHPAPGVLRGFRVILLLAVEEAVRRPLVGDELVLDAGVLERSLEGGVLIGGDVLVGAGLPSVPDATPPAVPQNQGAEVAGAALYVRDGCINCHGPNGLGGVPNPQSPDKTIPPLSGLDFRTEFNTDKKIEDVIRSGSVLGQAPIVSMPHWGGILSDADLAALVAYLKTLK